MPKALSPLRVLLIWNNLKGHYTPEMVLWLFAHGVMPLYTPLAGSWLNMAESIQRILVRRAVGIVSRRLLCGAANARHVVHAVANVDTGYVDAELLITSQENYGINVVGPICENYRWQVQADQGFAAQHFQIDWERQQAVCPGGHTSLSWTPAVSALDDRAATV